MTVGARKAAAVAEPVKAVKAAKATRMMPAPSLPAQTAKTPKRKIRQDRARAAKTDWRPAFLADLAEHCNVTHACGVVGVSKQTAYQSRVDDAVFAAAWEDAIDSAVERLEFEARQRAVNESDTLMIFLLKAHRPERYRERHDVTSAGKAIEGAKVYVGVNPEDEV